MTILDKIIAQKKIEVKELKIVCGDMEKIEREKRPSLFETLKQSKKMNIISEVKRASPSKGNINENVDPIAQAKKYAEAGVGAISVLTDKQFFKGSMADLLAVSEVVDVPLLCKDFMIDEIQIDVAKRHGASIILLIAAALPEERLKELYDYAQLRELDVLFEVHNIEEAKIALRIGAKVIGINNRNLKTFEVDLGTTEEVAEFLKDEDIILVSESGIKTVEDVERVEKSGAKAILVGETLMRADDIGETIKRFQIPIKELEKEC